MTAKQKLSLAVALLATLLGGYAVVALVGHQARLVDLIALFASGFGAGAALVAALRARVYRATTPTSATAGEP